MATARFLHSQHPEGTAYVIGESGLTTALHEQGYTLTEADPRYVVVGETTSYSFESIARAIRLVAAGARFISTNPDVAAPSEAGTIPATGALAALISSASGVKPYVVGKPNPLMMRTALNAIDAHSEESVMIGDNMDTDVIMGLESGLETILVLSGVTRREDVQRYSYAPTRVLDSVADIEP
jgi:NagD protein